MRAGLLSAYVVALYCSVTLATDVQAQALVQAVGGGGLMMLSCTWLVCVIRENKITAEEDAKPQTPFLATMNALRRNGPYTNYLAIRLWLTFAFHLPFFSRLNYLKCVTAPEDAEASLLAHPSRTAYCIAHPRTSSLTIPCHYCLRTGT